MTEIDNLSNKEANKKIKQLAESADICMFTTALTQLPLTTRPMSTQKADEDGTLWFFSKKDGNKVTQLREDNRVQLFYSNLTSSEYLSVYGRATLIQDEAKAKELWSAMVKTWFNGGPDDPNLMIIKVVPEDGYYWDTKDGKLISLMKIAAGAIAGREMDGSIEGELKS